MFCFSPNGYIMNRSFLFFILVFAAVGSRAEKPSTVTRTRVDSVLELSYNSYATMDIHSSLTHAMEAVSLSEQIGYSRGKARGNFYIAQVMWSLGENGEAIEYLHRAEREPYVAGDLILLSEINRVKGRTYGSMKLYELSVNEFKKGLRHIHQIDTEFERKYLASLAYDNLSTAYALQEVPDSALHYLQKNKELLESMTEERLFRNKVNLYAQLGKEHANRADYDSAVYYFNTALELADSNNYPYTSWIYLEWGNMNRNQGLLDSALVKCRWGLENLEKTRLKNELPAFYSALRDIYMLKGNSDSALVYQQKKITIENELGTANKRALDKAVQILLSEEKGYQKLFLNRAKSMLFAALVLLALLASGGWVAWRRRYRRISEKEREMEEVFDEKRGNALEEVIDLAKKNDNSFLPRFMELFPNFTQNIYLRHPNLTQSSFQFCTYIFLHFSSKEIAECLFVEHKSVQTRKNRLRKQLGMPRNTDLYQYMRWLDEPLTENSPEPSAYPEFF